MIPKKIIIANWKENPDSLSIAHSLLKISNTFNLKESPSKEYFIGHAVPYIFAGILKKENQNENIILQNISQYNSGSHTGEISAAQASKLGISMSIVGHSETRLSPTNTRGDEDKDINLKIKNLIAQNMAACLCVGEYERENTDWKKVLEEQLSLCLKEIDIENYKNILLAYEPVWAIGEKAKRPATNEEIVETITFIKEFIQKKLLVPDEVKVLYGGSVDENNAREILDTEIVDGLLVGRASSDPSKWENLLNTIN